MRYLDPKADLTFKKVFGEHEDITISFLNAMLPLAPGEEVTNVKFIPTELVPQTPDKKNSIVDVRCTDNNGRQFIVEMQMIWTDSYEQRVLFNASKAYVKQLESGEDYHLLQPVYSLNIINDDIHSPGFPRDTFYHHFRLVHEQHTDRIIDGLQLIFVELPKFVPANVTDRRMMVLWLRFLTEINERTRQAPEELLKNAEVTKALDIVEESAYTDAQLLGYEKFWDAVSLEKMRMNGKLAEGIKLGREEERLAMARRLKQLGVSPEIINNATGLSLENITTL